MLSSPVDWIVRAACPAAPLAAWCLGNRVEEAHTLTHLGDTHHAAGHLRAKLRQINRPDQ